MQLPGIVRGLAIAVASLLALAAGRVAGTDHPAAPGVRAQGQPAGISASEFARLVRESSEAGGSFWSDNFVSNETSYLHVVGNLEELAAPGGAYIGVGPEQNFSYIARLRPRIAFIVDIRRQAMVQHLMFKALFHRSESRGQFLSRLLSRPLSGTGAPGADASLDEMLDHFARTPGDERACGANLADVRKIIRDDFRLRLSSPEDAALERVHASFCEAGLDIAFRLDARGASHVHSHSFRRLLAERDLDGRPGSFLASSRDYDFVRGMHERNLIIPVVGDFAGGKALAAIGEYLRRRGDTVTAFYLSNVEQYLFAEGSFERFVANVEKLPMRRDSLFIRAVFDIERPHPSQLPGHRVTTLLQRLPVFLKDYRAGRYRDYWALVTTNFVAAEKSGSCRQFQGHRSPGPLFGENGVPTLQPLSRRDPR